MPLAPYTTRLATLDDVGEIEALIHRSMWSLGARDYTPAQVASVLKYAMGVDTQLIRDGTYFVVVEPSTSRIVGAGGWSFRKMLHGGDGAKQPGDEAPLDPATEPARIRAFFVDPAHARRGLGRLILNASEEAARRAGFSVCELMATLPGVPLYRACGYEDVEPTTLHLPDGTQLGAVLMRKRAERRGQK